MLIKSFLINKIVNLKYLMMQINLKFNNCSINHNNPLQRNANKYQVLQVSKTAVNITGSCSPRLAAHTNAWPAVYSVRFIHLNR